MEVHPEAQARMTDWYEKKGWDGPSLAMSEALYERDALSTQVASMREALEGIEQWWLDVGVKHFDGAPFAIYRLRETLSILKDQSNDH